MLSSVFIIKYNKEYKNYYIFYVLFRLNFIFRNSIYLLQKYLFKSNVQIKIFIKIFILLNLPENTRGILI